MQCVKLVALAVALTSLVACREKWDVKNYAENIAETTCAKAYECCTVDDIAASEQTNYGNSRDACEDKIADVLNFKEDTIERGIDKSRLVYHGAVLEHCLANYAKLSCDDLKNKATATVAACDGVLVPLVPENGRCDMDEECLEGYCRFAKEGDEEGTCSRFIEVGEPCAELSCAPGTYCLDTCVPTKADGESCRNNFECTTGGCNGADADTDAAGTCGPMGGVDSTCYLTKGCMAAEPQVFAALATVVWFVRRRRITR